RRELPVAKRAREHRVRPQAQAGRRGHDPPPRRRRAPAHGAEGTRRRAPTAKPFGALAQQTRLLMGAEVLRLWRETGATILLITHALDEAAMLSDRVGGMSARPGGFLVIIN